MTSRKTIFEHPAVARVEAFALLLEGKPVGKCVVAYPSDGAGIVKASVVAWEGQLASDKLNFGIIGRAGGYGYDKSVAAVADALCKAGIDCPNHGWNESGLFEHFGYTVFQVI